MEQIHKTAAVFDTFSTAELEQLLRDDSNGTHTLPQEDILAICQILARRQPASRSAQAAWQQFLRHYTPCNDHK